MGIPDAPHSVITGAGGGFGRALALLLAGRGSRLTLSAINLQAVEEPAQLADSAGAKGVRARRCDVTKIEDVEAFAAAAEAHRPGREQRRRGQRRPDRMPLKDWKWTRSTSSLFYGVIHCCRVFVPMLRAQGQGHVLNVASAGRAPRGATHGRVQRREGGRRRPLRDSLGRAGGQRDRLHGALPHCTRPTSRQERTLRRRQDPRARRGPRRQGQTADGIARAMPSKACRRDSLYAIPMADGRWMWRFKRASPVGFRNIAGRVAKRMFP